MCIRDRSKAEANLTANGADAKGDVCVLAPNDGTSRAIADVFSTDKDVTSYVISGQDAEKASIQYIIDGKQSMTVFKDTRTLAADSVAMAVSVLNGETPATDTTCLLYTSNETIVKSKEVLEKVRLQFQLTAGYQHQVLLLSWKGQCATVLFPKLLWILQLFHSSQWIFPS